MINYLKKLLNRETTDVVFVGYQSRGTPGRLLQRGTQQVELDGSRVVVNAKIHTLTGYSAHGDQHDLMSFAMGMAQPPGEVVLVHGEEDGKRAMQRELEACDVSVSPIFRK